MTMHCLACLCDKHLPSHAYSWYVASSKVCITLHINYPKLDVKYRLTKNICQSLQIQQQRLAPIGLLPKHGRIDWWTRPYHLKMLCWCLSDMSVTKFGFKRAPNNFRVMKNYCVVLHTPLISLSIHQL